MGVRFRRWHVLAGVVAAVVLVAGAVFVWQSGSDDPPPPAAKPARPKPVLKPLRLADSPLWTSQGLGLDPAPAAADMVGGTMVIQQGNPQVEGLPHVTLGITAVDVSTGAVRYTLNLLDDLPGHGDSQYSGVSVNSSGLIMEWVSTAGDAAQMGLALVSATDGRTVWETTVIPSSPTPDTGTRLAMHAEVVTDDVVLVSVGAGGLMDDDYHKKPPLRTLAVDARTGATLWESQDPMWPNAVAGDTVVGTVPVPNSTKWTVVGADLHTGRRTWTRPGELDEASVEQVAGDVALLRGRTGDPSAPERLVFVDTATGRAITELDDPWHFTSCDDDDRTLIVCAGPDKTSDADKAAADDDLVAIFRVDKRTVTTELVGYGDLRVIDAWSGRAVLSGRPHGDSALVFTMDSVGNVIDKDLRLPGRLEDLTADKATFVTDRARVEVYKVSR